MVVGLIADTHGVIRDAALHALAGVDLILHAGDVGHQRVLEALAAIAPVRAVSGNVDLPGAPLRPALELVLDGIRVHVSHGHEIGNPTPERLAARYETDVIVFGHTHRAVVSRIRSTLVINPGAAGPARFKSKPSVGRLTLPERDAHIIAL